MAELPKGVDVTRYLMFSNAEQKSSDNLQFPSFQTSDVAGNYCSGQQPSFEYSATPDMCQKGYSSRNLSSTRDLEVDALHTVHDADRVVDSVPSQEESYMPQVVVPTVPVLRSLSQISTGLSHHGYCPEANNTTVSINNVSNVQYGTGNVMYVGSGPPPNIPPKKRYRITASNEPLDERNMDMVMREIGHDWRSLARQLGFSEGEIDALQHDYVRDGLLEIIYQCLRKWREKKGRQATLSSLADSLIATQIPRCYEIASKLSPAEWN